MIWECVYSDSIIANKWLNYSLCVMLDNFLKEVSSLVAEGVRASSDIPAEKRDLTIEVMSEAIVDGFAENYTRLASFFAGNGSSHLVTENVKKRVINDLVKKVRLDSERIRNFVESAYPLFISAFIEKLNNEEELDIKHVVKILSEKENQKEKNLSDLLSAFDNLLN